MVIYRTDIYGISEHHAKDYIVDHKHSSAVNGGIYELLCFATPAVLLTDAGMQNVATGDVILHSPDFRIYHFSMPAEPVGFVNDWLYILTDSMNEFLSVSGIHLNRLIHAGDPMLMREALLQISDELLHRRILYVERISSIIEVLLIDVARAEGERTRLTQPFAAELIELRRALLRDYAREWTVSDMARRLNLSSSRFSVLYKQQFGESPVNDLINARLRAAQLMLAKNPCMTLREIALECGFQNEYYFSKVFKSRIGVAPSVYRG